MRNSGDIPAANAAATAGAIIDLDGTILDSLPYWEAMPRQFLADYGRTPRPDLMERLGSMELAEASRYLKETYDLPLETEAIARELRHRIRAVYTELAPLRPGARELLDRLKAAGIRLALLTAAEATAADAALRRNGVRQHFDLVISTDEAGCPKSDPRAYLYALRRLGTAPGQTVVYEDAQYAIDGACQAGLRVLPPP